MHPLSCALYSTLCSTLPLYPSAQSALGQKNIAAAAVFESSNQLTCDYPSSRLIGVYK